MGAGSDYREVKAYDYLDETVKDTEALKKGDTSQRKFTPKYIIPASDQVQVGDDVVVNPNKIEVLDEVEVAVNVTVTGYLSGSFQVCESENSNGTGVTAPGIVDFSDCGA